MKRPVLHALIVSVVLSGLGLAFALYSVGGPAALLKVGELSPSYLCLATLALLASFVLSATRLQFIAASVGFRVRPLHAVRAHVLGMFSAAVTPGGSGGMPGLALTLGFQGMSHTKAWAAAVATLSADTAFHAWAMPTSLIALYAMEAYPRTPMWTALGVSTILLTLALAYVLLFRVAWLRPILSWFMRGPLLRFRRATLRFADGFIASSQVLSAAPLWKHAVIQLLTALAWAAYFLVLYFLLAGLGVDLSVWLALFGQVVITVMSTFVPTPGASGFFEVALSWLLIGRGSGEAGPTAVFVWRLLTFFSLFVLGPLLGGYLLAGQVSVGSAAVSPTTWQSEGTDPNQERQP